MNVLICGAGLIGCSWAVILAQRAAHVSVWLIDPDAEALAHARERISRDAATQASSQRRGTPPAAALQLRTSWRDVPPCEILIEAIPEDREKKQELYMRLTSRAASARLIFTATSGFRPSDLIQGFAFRDRFLVIHPISPPHLLPAVELCASPWTSAATASFAEDWTRSLGLSPVWIRQEIVGFAANRLQLILWMEASRLVAQGAITASDVDLLIRETLGKRWAVSGLFETLRLTGRGTLEASVMRQSEYLTQMLRALNSEGPVTLDALRQVARMFDIETSARDTDNDRARLRRDAQLAAVFRALHEIENAL